MIHFLRFGPLTFQVTQANPQVVDPDNDGYCARIFHRRGLILIADNLPEDQIPQSLWHEILHQICIERNIQLEEAALDALAYGLHTFMVDNPQLASLYKGSPC